MMMMHFYSAFSRFICSNTLRNTLRRKVSPDCVELFTILGRKFAPPPHFFECCFRKQGHTITPAFPTLSKNCVGHLTCPAYQYRQDVGDGAYGFIQTKKNSLSSTNLQG